MAANTREEPFFIVTELIEPGSLEKCLQEKGAFSVTDVRDIACDVLTGLSYLHFKGVAHRDLKPANILLENCGAKFRAKIAGRHFISLPPKSTHGLPMQTLGQPDSSLRQKVILLPWLVHMHVSSL